MPQEATPASKKKVIEVFPLSKPKRILAFLADYFISFILGLAFFHLAVHPIAKAIVNYDAQVASLLSTQRDRDSVLYGNKLLFVGPNLDELPGSFSSNLEYTCKRYVCSFLTDPMTVEDDVFRRYHVDIRGTSANTWITFCTNLDNGLSFFQFGEGTMSLKPEYVEEFKPLLDPKDEMSAKGEEDYTRFQEKYFLQGYSQMLGDIGDKDLTYNGISYKTEQAKVAGIIRQQQNLILWSSVIAEFLSLLVCFFLVPMLSKHRKTIGMMAMRIERVNADNFAMVRRKEVFPYWVYQVTLNFSAIFFLPLPVLGFNELFTLTTPLFLSLASLAIVVISFLFVLFHSFNRSLLDLATNSMLISNEQLDEVYHAKGYDY